MQHHHSNSGSESNHPPRRGSVFQNQQHLHDYECVVEILQKKDRSFKDLEMLHSKIRMLDGFHMFIENYFQGSDQNEQIKLCGELKYERKNKGEIIFEQDEPSNNKLYIILNGRCHLFLSKDLDFEEDPSFKKYLDDTAAAAASTANTPKKNVHSQNRKSQHVYFRSKEEEDRLKKLVSPNILRKMKKIGSKYRKHLQFDFKTKHLSQNEVNMLRVRYGKTTRLIEAGNIFGERAIIKSQPRTATIIADSHPTELIVLDRDKFLPALDALKHTLQLRRDILFKVFKEMDNYSSARLESMFYSFQVQNYTRGHQITEQDFVSDQFFIVAEGEAQVLKKINVPTGKNGKTEERTAKLSIIGKNFKDGPGVMVGDEIMLHAGDAAYTYTTEVVSLRASILVADKKTIDKKFPKDLKEYLRSQAFFREKARKVLLENKVAEMIKEADQKSQNHLLLYTNGHTSSSSTGAGDDSSLSMNPLLLHKHNHHHPQQQQQQSQQLQQQSSAFDKSIIHLQNSSTPKSNKHNNTQHQQSFAGASATSEDFSSIFRNYTNSQDQRTVISSSFAPRNTENNHTNNNSMNKTVTTNVFNTQFHNQFQQQKSPQQHQQQQMQQQQQQQQVQFQQAQHNQQFQQAKQFTHEQQMHFLQQQQYMQQLQSQSNNVFHSQKQFQTQYSHHQTASQFGQSQSNSLFDFRKFVFDFGDGKNIENAERVERMFRMRNRKFQKGNEDSSENRKHSDSHNTQAAAGTTGHPAIFGTPYKKETVFLKHSKHREIVNLLTEQTQPKSAISPPFFKSHQDQLEEKQKLEEQRLQTEAQQLFQSQHLQSSFPSTSSLLQQPMQLRKTLVLSPRLKTQPVNVTASKLTKQQQQQQNPSSSLTSTATSTFLNSNSSLGNLKSLNLFNSIKEKGEQLRKQSKSISSFGSLTVSEHFNSNNSNVATVSITAMKPLQTSSMLTASANFNEKNAMETSNQLEERMERHLKVPKSSLIMNRKSNNGNRKKHASQISSGFASNISAIDSQSMAMYAVSPNNNNNSGFRSTKSISSNSEHVSMHSINLGVSKGIRSNPTSLLQKQLPNSNSTNSSEQNTPLIAGSQLLLASNGQSQNQPPYLPVSNATQTALDFQEFKVPARSSISVMKTGTTIAGTSDMGEVVSPTLAEPPVSSNKSQMRRYKLTSLNCRTGNNSLSFKAQQQQQHQQQHTCTNRIDGSETSIHNTSDPFFPGYSSKYNNMLEQYFRFTNYKFARAVPTEPPQ